MNETSYVVIQAFMVNDLKLSGNELIVYAVIHGFTHDGGHWYYGTRGHLAEWCGASKGTVSNCLRSLLEKGYIKRREVDQGGYKQVQYKALFCNGVTKIDRGGVRNRAGSLSKIGDSNTLKSKPNRHDAVSGMETEIRECPTCGTESKRYGAVFVCEACNKAWRLSDD